MVKVEDMRVGEYYLVGEDGKHHMLILKHRNPDGSYNLRFMSFNFENQSSSSEFQAKKAPGRIIESSNREFQVETAHEVMVRDMQIGKEYLVDGVPKKLIYKTDPQPRHIHDDPQYTLTFSDGSKKNKYWYEKFMLLVKADGSRSFGGKKTRRKIKKRKPNKSKKARKSAQKSRR